MNDKTLNSTNSVTWILSALLLAVCIPAIAQPGSVSVSVLSYNVRVDFDGSSWQRRRDAIRSILTQERFDILALQEASEIMIADYQAMLPDYFYIVGERSDGHRDDQGWYEYMPVFYNQTRFRLIDRGEFWVGEAPDRPGDTLLNSRDHGRIFNWLILEEISSGTRFAVGNAHTHPERSEVGVQLLSEKFRTAIGDLPAILVGDFNATPDTEAYRYLTSPALGNWQDAFITATVRQGQEVTVLANGEWLPDGPDTQRTGSSPRRIDYLFASPDVTVDRYAVDKTPISPNFYPSDHFALLAELIIPGSQSASIGNLRSEFLDPHGAVDVVAHRACWGPAPENSISAIRNCVNSGVAVIEIDIRASADGHLVLLHDDTAARTTNRSQQLAELTLQQFQGSRLRVGQGGSEASLTHESPPSFDEVLAITAGKLMLNLDVKEIDLLPRIHETVKTANLESQVIYKTNQPVGDIALPEWLEGSNAIYMPIVRIRSLEDVAALNFAPEIGAVEVLFENPEVFAEFVERFGDRLAIWVNTLSPSHSAGIVDAMTVSSPDNTWGALIEAGADIIQTDRPLELMSFLNGSGTP